jgi:hypothetical protein
VHDLIEALFARSPAIRYVAVYQDGVLTTAARPGVTDASAAESDKYEELLVNPTLLTLVSQRGNIDCGGLQFVVIRYGHFYQFVAPYAGGHLSIAIEPDADALAVVGLIRATLQHTHIRL